MLRLPMGRRGTTEYNTRKALTSHIHQVHAELGARTASGLADDSMLSFRLATECPECGAKPSARRKRATESKLRAAIMNHATVEHPELGDRLRSLLADAAIGEFDWAGREMWHG